MIFRLQHQSWPHRQRWLLLGVLLTVGCVDQIGKAWAWRHLGDVHVNAGGDMLVGSVVGSWFRDRTIGAVFDVLDATLLVVAAMMLVRRRRSPALLCGGALALAGWASNLGDRLGLHFWTAPGSMRGVVDFLPWDGRYWNVADTAIIAGSAVFAAALLWRALHMLAPLPQRCRHRAVHHRRLGRSRRSGAVLTLVLAVTVAAVLAGISATGYAGVASPDMFAPAQG